MKKSISTPVVLATILGTLPFIGGLTAILFNLRYHYHESALGPSVGVSIGLLLIVLALLSENPGPYQRMLVIARNALVLLFCAVALLALVVILVGPLH